MVPGVSFVIELLELSADVAVVGISFLGASLGARLFPPLERILVLAMLYFLLYFVVQLSIIIY